MIYEINRNWQRVKTRFKHQGSKRVLLQRSRLPAGQRDFGETANVQIGLFVVGVNAESVHVIITLVVKTYQRCPCRQS
jgi:hypothetical protein